MLRLLVLAILLASVMPVTGDGRVAAQWVSNAAIFVLFLLNGLRLPRSEVRCGVGNWRMLLPVLAWSFGAMALIGKGLELALADLLPPLVGLGFLYLGVMPSTVQSATAYSSLGGGNVASSVVIAALANVLAIFICAPLFAALGGGGVAAMDADRLLKVVWILILPFALGQALQTAFAGWVGTHRALVTWVDRFSIAIAVYVAFSGAVEQGLWAVVSAKEWAALLGGVVTLLAVGFVGSWTLAKAVGLDRADQIAFLFAGAHKSIAMGAPLAAVLFQPQVAGMVLLPLLIYHLLQQVASAPIASRLARHPGPRRHVTDQNGSTTIAGTRSKPHRAA